ncbi:hypothetical protein NDK43_20430 [Neobacillus pocheonensis]|uniref:Uncharacterized protein n=1 Tax=Neobacillus pocheonensis TaxID=363869 RepID=A0ABT0WD90_9BACI|nr:hypothetical protein [Neobacillus pocheonensis]
MATTKELEKNVSSLELLWNQAFQNIDAWVEREQVREDNLLKFANLFAANVKQNQENLKELAKQFSIELSNWEKTSREELLTATISLQSFFPIKSYEEINDKLDGFKNVAKTNISSPLNNLVNGQFADKYVSTLEKFIELRRNNRNLFVKNLKGSASIIRTNQSAFLNTITNQVKNVIFPFHKYLERSNELTN